MSEKDRLDPISRSTLALLTFGAGLDFTWNRHFWFFTWNYRNGTCGVFVFHQGITLHYLKFFRESNLHATLLSWNCYKYIRIVPLVWSNMDLLLSFWFFLKIFKIFQRNALFMHFLQHWLFALLNRNGNKGSKFKAI